MNSATNSASGTSDAYSLPRASGARMGWVTLHFDQPDLEAGFRRDYFRKSLRQVRISVAIGLFLFAGFGVLDPYIIPDATHTAWAIRYLVVCPFILLVLGLTFAPVFERMMQAAVGAVGLVACIGITGMIVAAQPPGSYYYYAGLLLACTFINTFMRLRFVPAALVSWSAVVIYEAMAYARTPTIIFVNNTFFLVTVNFVTSYACYFMERSVRVDFLQKRTIQQQALQLNFALQDVELARREAEEQSRHDPLTELFNRRYFADVLALELESARHTQAPLAAMMLDLDRFKRINDTYGHATGDEVLRTVAKEITASVRRSDMACRYGGEEFAVLLVHSDAAAARCTASRLLESIAASRVETPGGLLAVTASIGIAVHEPGARDADGDTLLARADQALYAAKQAGRNRWVVWDADQSQVG
ncbi:MAG: diguanylate cyclase [Gammaproteobacteria bacterium]